MQIRNSNLWLYCCVLYLVLDQTYQTQEIGCFRDDFGNGTSSVFDGLVSSVKQCVDRCKKLNHPYAALKNGDGCWCGDKFHLQKKDNKCDKKCNSGDVCGGISSNTVYRVHTISWKIICVTSNRGIADSQANQRMILDGLNGSSKQINLDWKKGRFERRSIDTFYNKTKDIGPLQNVTMWNDNTRRAPIWVVTNITFVNLNDGSIYVTVMKDIYVNRSRMVSLVKNTFIPTTQASRSSTEINPPQETSVPFETDESSTYSSESYTIETESESFLDTAPTETTIPTNAGIFEESTNTADTTINIITNDAAINKMTTTTTTATTFMTIPTNSSNATTTTSSTPAPMCSCPCRKKLSKKEQIEHLKELKKELTIDKKETSSYIRKKISAPDNRVSARATGYVGIVLLIVPFAAIVLADLSKLITYLMAKYHESKV